MKAEVMIAAAFILTANIFFASALVDDRISLGVNLDTDLNASMMGSSGNSYMQVHMPDGQERRVSVLPLEASIKVMSQFNSSCEDGVCDVEMAEENTDDGWKVVYVVHTDKKVELFGFMDMSMPLEVVVDAQDGQIMRVEKPWWAVLSSNTSITGNVAAWTEANAGNNGNNNSDDINEKDKTSTSDSGEISVDVSANSSVKASSVVYTKNSYRAIGRDGMDRDSSSSNSNSGNDQNNDPWQCPYLTE